MGLRIAELDGRETGVTGAVLYCSSSEWCFGPRFQSFEACEEFVEWAMEEKNISDLRKPTSSHLETLYGEWVSGGPWRVQIRRILGDHSCVITPPPPSSSVPSYRFTGVLGTVGMDALRDALGDSLVDELREWRREQKLLKREERVEKYHVLRWLVEKCCGGEVLVASLRNREEDRQGLLWKLIQWSGHDPDPMDLEDWGLQVMGEKNE